MRFAVDAHAVGRHQTGNEVYIRNLLEQFAVLDEDSDFVTFIADPSAAAQIPERFHKQQVSANPFCRLGIDLPRHTRERRPELLHVQYTAPLGSAAPILASVHDVSFLDAPGYFTRARALQLKLTVGRTVQKAAKIITVSDFSRRAILRHYPIPPEKVVMIPNAVSAAFRPVEQSSARFRIAQKFGIRSSFILTVGDLQPRKNHLGLLAAFEKLVRSGTANGNPVSQHLVFVGKDTWHSPEIHRAVERSEVRDRVHFTGFVDDADLVDFYGACDLFVFPSFYEGFGLPILEAMACGRAVACSNATAMPEVADGAGILFDPGSRSQMAKAMARVLYDADLRATLERRGLRRAKLFSWERSARLTLEVYYEIAGVARKFEHADRVLLPSAAC
jgi:glycosyltransferase involved in cell wall biosynthesis